MSLDVYLEKEGAATPVEKGIYIREDGQTKLISLDEWNQRFPDRTPVVLDLHEEEDDTVFHYNITHNLGGMAREAGIYQHLWRPEELDITKASQLIKPLTDGLNLLQSDPERFKAFNPPNGWGSYEGLVKFVSEYLEACKEYPDALVRTWR